jgi:hypothetical protein
MSMNAATNTARLASTISLFNVATARLFIIGGTRALERQDLAAILEGHWSVIGDAMCGVSFRHNRTVAEIEACETACRKAGRYIAGMFIVGEAVDTAADFRNGLFLVADRCRTQLANAAKAAA